MPQIPLQLPAGSVVGRDGQAANARLINAYAEQIERDGKSAYAVYCAPGLTRWDSGNFAGGCRGLIGLDENNLIAVLGNEVVKFNTAGAGAVIGTITGSGPVIMALNREIPKSIAITTADSLYYLVTGGDTVAKQSIADLPPPQSVTYLAGRFLYSIRDGRVFASGIDDGTTVNAAAFLTANIGPDNNVRAYAYNGYLYVFGKESTEVWAPDEALANQPFPYSNTKQTITHGLMAAHALAEMDDGLIWVDNGGIVRYGVPGGAHRISTHTVERSIEALTPDEKGNLTASAAVWHGHKVCILRSAKRCWWYDLRTQQWIERKSYGSDTWLAAAAVPFNGLTIFGSAADGKLYYLDPDAFDEAGAPLVMEVQCGAATRFPGHMIVDALYIDVIGGIGLQTGDAADVNPALLIDYSDDGGKTFEGERSESLGAIGQFETTVESYRWGLVREKGRTWRFRSSAKALKGIIQANLQVRGSRG